MGLVRAALRRPITVIVVMLALSLLSGVAILRMPADIFPVLDLPVIYVAQPFGGMDPGQIEAYLVSYYEYHFLYVAGIERVESRSIQNVGVVKLFFHPGTDMNQALAQTVAYVERSRAFMPPGTLPPFVMRFDAGNVPVGQLVFASAQRTVGEIQDAALFKVRPMFATLPGVSAPPPFGGNQRTIVVRADPERLRSHRMTPDEVVRALASGNLILPAGNVRMGGLTRLTPVNSVVSEISELLDLPIRAGQGAQVLLRDVGTVESGTDIPTGYALVDGKRTVYVPVNKRSDASTLTVVDSVKANLARFQAVLPPDVSVRFEFDQSVFVRHALASLAREGALGALLTGLMVLLFLGSLKSAFIVLLTIPLALLGAVVGLWASAQTINIMTLGGLALAVGILVDEAVVALENIHAHLGRGTPVGHAVVEASRETAVPRLLAMLCVVAVFVPSFFMKGVARALFVPLSLAVGFAMIASYVLSSTLVPVMAAWMLRSGAAHEGGLFERIRRLYIAILGRVVRVRWLVLIAYLAGSAALLVHFGGRLGVEVFPRVDTGQLQLRLRAPTGTRIERTEELCRKALEVIGQTAGADAVAITLAFVGTQPPSYPINSIYLWTSGPQEAVIRVALREGTGVRIAELEEKLRSALPKVLPECRFSFEAGDVVAQIMNFGAPAPVEVAIGGPSLSACRDHAVRILEKLNGIPDLRDVAFGEPLDYPTIEVQIDRMRAGQLGVTVEQVGRSLVSATSSSRLVAPIFWRDPTSGVAYQIQVEVPQSMMASLRDMQSVPVLAGGSGPFLRDVASLRYGTMPGEIFRDNMRRTITITANVVGVDLGRAAALVDGAIRAAGDPPKAVSVQVRGQIAPMKATLTDLRTGLLAAILTIFLLLAANFQSFRLAGVALAVVPAVLSGVVVALHVTGTTVNVQSFMGAIMAIGVSVANSILLVTVAEDERVRGASALDAGLAAAGSRLRAISMTSIAMVAGMVPMALAFGEGGEQTAPLGRAVIGGLLAAAMTTLLVLPCVFSIVQAHVTREPVSLDPQESPPVPDSRKEDGCRVPQE